MILGRFTFLKKKNVWVKPFNLPGVRFQACKKGCWAKFSGSFLPAVCPVESAFRVGQGIECRWWWCLSTGVCHSYGRNVRNCEPVLGGWVGHVGSPLYRDVGVVWGTAYALWFTRTLSSSYFKAFLQTGSIFLQAQNNERWIGVFFN